MNPLSDPQSKLRRYRRILAVQETFQEHWHEGLTIKYIHTRFIESRYFISYNTLRSYLGINAKKEIKILEKQINENHEQK